MSINKDINQTVGEVESMYDNIISHVEESELRDKLETLKAIAIKRANNGNPVVYVDASVLA